MTELDALFVPYTQPDAPGGCVGVIQQGRVCRTLAFGLADLESGTAVTPATNFRLASLSKQFTATAVLLLAQRGQLALTYTLPHFFPHFPAYGHSITLHHLLNHTAGLPDYEDLIPSTTQIPLKDKDVLVLLQQETAGYFPPGAAFRYSNSAYALLALVVERVSGLSFAAFLAQNIFQPVGMAGTVAYEAGISQVARRAAGYHPVVSGFVRRDQSLTSSVLGDGGIYSSVEDLFRWDQSLYTDQVLRAAWRTAAWTPQTWVKDGRLAYGYGWFIEQVEGQTCHWHFGSTTGFRTAVERYPAVHLTVLVLLNRDEADGQEMLAHTLARQVARLYLAEGMV
ncbi:MAG: beta-lactamase family protein [Anaerolineales bacterium]|nr:beta-lactamase family protein [Anaerolineales bacterium]